MSSNVTISRALNSTTFPANFVLIASLNPCPCGYAGDPSGRCGCSVERVHAYRARLSGPLLDRIDLHVSLPPVDVASLSSRDVGEASDGVRQRVTRARETIESGYSMPQSFARTDSTETPFTGPAPYQSRAAAFPARVLLRRSGTIS